MSEAVAAGLITAEQIAGSVLGERCWVRWPFLQEALVQAVSDRTQKARLLSFCLPACLSVCLPACRPSVCNLSGPEPCKKGTVLHCMLGCQLAIAGSSDGAALSAGGQATWGCATWREGSTGLGCLFLSAHKAIHGQACERLPCCAVLCCAVLCCAVLCCCFLCYVTCPGDPQVTCAVL